MGKTTYEITVEIYHGNHCEHHTVGQTFTYPDDIGAICPWLLDSMNGMIRVLQFGGTLPWRYNDTACFIAAQK